MRKTYIIVATLIIVSFIFVLINSLSGTVGKKSPSKEIPNTNPEVLKLDYSNINKVLPGQSTISDVVRLNGEPVSSKTIGLRKYLFFQTPIKSFNNLVVFEKGVVVYALEGVFGDYRGSYENLTRGYGAPDITLYDQTSPFVWYIFLQKGVGVQTNEKDIAAILYFLPQNENSFISSVANDLGLSKATPKPEVLRP